MAENAAGIILNVLSLGLGGLVAAAGWPLVPMRWIGGIGVVVGIAGLARIAGVA